MRHDTTSHGVSFGDFEHAEALFARGALDSAELRMERVLLAAPELAAAHHLHGHIELTRRNVREARVAFERAIGFGLAPFDTAAELWTCAMLLGDVDSA